MAKRTRYQAGQRPKPAATAAMGTITIQPEPTAPPTLRDASTPQLGYLTSSGYVDVSREGRPIPPESEEGQAIQEVYSEQFDTTIDNAIQYDRFARYTKGEASIEDTLLNTGTTNRYQGAGIKSNRDKLIRAYFEERGIPLTEQFKNVNLSPTKYREARARAKLATDTGVPMGDLRDLLPSADDYRKSGQAMPAVPADASDDVREIVARRNDFLISSAEVKAAAERTADSAQVKTTGVGVIPGVPAMLSGYFVAGGLLTQQNILGSIGRSVVDPLRQAAKADKVIAGKRGTGKGYDPVSRTIAKQDQDQVEREEPMDMYAAVGLGERIIDDGGVDDYRNINPFETGIGTATLRASKAVAVPVEQLGAMGYYAVSGTPMEEWKIKESALDLLINPLVEPLAPYLTSYSEMNITGDWGANISEFGGATATSLGRITSMSEQEQAMYWQEVGRVGGESIDKFQKYPAYYTLTALGEVPLMLMGAGEVGVGARVSGKIAAAAVRLGGSNAARTARVSGKKLVDDIAKADAEVTRLEKGTGFNKVEYDKLTTKRAEIAEKINYEIGVKVTPRTTGDEVQGMLYEMFGVGPQYARSVPKSQRNLVDDLIGVDRKMGEMTKPVGPFQPTEAGFTAQRKATQLANAIQKREDLRTQLLKQTNPGDSDEGRELYRVIMAKSDNRSLIPAVQKQADDVERFWNNKADFIEFGTVDRVRKFGRDIKWGIKKRILPYDINVGDRTVLRGQFGYTRAVGQGGVASVASMKTGPKLIPMSIGAALGLAGPGPMYIPSAEATSVGRFALKDTRTPFEKLRGAPVETQPDLSVSVERSLLQAQFGGSYNRMKMLDTMLGGMLGRKASEAGSQAELLSSIFYSKPKTTIPDREITLKADTTTQQVRVGRLTPATAVVEQPKKGKAFEEILASDLIIEAPHIDTRTGELVVGFEKYGMVGNQMKKGVSPDKAPVDRAPIQFGGRFEGQPLTPTETMQVYDMGGLGGYRGPTAAFEGIPTQMEVARAFQRATTTARGASWAGDTRVWGALPKTGKRVRGVAEESEPGYGVYYSGLRTEGSVDPIVEGFMKLGKFTDIDALPKSNPLSLEYRKARSSLVNLELEEKNLMNKVKINNVLTSGVTWSSIESDDFLKTLFKVPAKSKKSISTTDWTRVRKLQDQVQFLERQPQTRATRDSLRKARTELDTLQYDTPTPTQEDFVKAMVASPEIASMFRDGDTVTQLERALTKDISKDKKKGLNDSLKKIKEAEKKIIGYEERIDELNKQTLKLDKSDPKTKYKAAKILPELGFLDKKISLEEATIRTEKKRAADLIDSLDMFLGEEVKYKSIGDNLAILMPTGLNKELLMTDEQFSRLGKIQNLKDGKRKEIADLERRAPAAQERVEISVKIPGEKEVTSRDFLEDIQVMDRVEAVNPRTGVTETTKLPKGITKFTGKTGREGGMLDNVQTTTSEIEGAVVDYEKLYGKDAKKMLIAHYGESVRNKGTDVIKVYGANEGGVPTSGKKKSTYLVGFNPKAVDTLEKQLNIGVSPVFEIKKYRTVKGKWIQRLKRRAKSKEVPVYGPRFVGEHQVFEMHTPTTENAAKMVNELKSKQQGIGVKSPAKQTFDVNTSVDKDGNLVKGKLTYTAQTHRARMEAGIDNDPVKLKEEQMAKEKAIKQVEDEINDLMGKMEDSDQIVKEGLPLWRMYQRMSFGEAAKQDVPQAGLKKGQKEKDLDVEYEMDPFWLRSSAFQKMNENVDNWERTVQAVDQSIATKTDVINVLVNKVNYKAFIGGTGRKPIIRRKLLMKDDYPMEDLSQTRIPVGPDGETPVGIFAEPLTADDFRRFFDDDIPLDDKTMAVNEKQYWDAVLDAVEAPDPAVKKLKSRWDDINDTETLTEVEKKEAFRGEAMQIINDSLGTNPNVLGGTQAEMDFRKMVGMIQDIEEAAKVRREFYRSRPMVVDKMLRAKEARNVFRNNIVRPKKVGQGRTANDPLISATYAAEDVVKLWEGGIPRKLGSREKFIKDGKVIIPRDEAGNITDPYLKDLFPDGFLPNEITVPTEFGYRQSTSTGSLPAPKDSKMPISKPIPFQGYVEIESPKYGTIKIPIYGEDDSVVTAARVQFTPSNVVRKEQLGPNQVWVMSTNMKGIHGKGNAKTGEDLFGGKRYQAEGMMPGERAFGVITKKEPNNNKGSFMTVDEVRPQMLKLRKAFAAYPTKEFVLPAIGTKNAKFTPEEMVGLLGDDAVRDNVILPQEFYNVLSPAQKSAYDKLHTKQTTTTGYQGITNTVGGGQTGVDEIGDIISAKYGIPTGGHMPHGYNREPGFDPNYAKKYNKKEGPDKGSASANYVARNRLNTEDSDATVYFGAVDAKGMPISRGGKATKREAEAAGKPFIVNPSGEELLRRAEELNIKTLNVAGSRKSTQTVGPDGLGNYDLMAKNALEYVFSQQRTKIEEGVTMPDTFDPGRYGGYIPQQVGDYLGGYVARTESDIFQKNVAGRSPVRTEAGMYMDSISEYQQGLRHGEATVKQGMDVFGLERQKLKDTAGELESVRNNNKAVLGALFEFNQGTKKVTDITTIDIDKAKLDELARLGHTVPRHTMRKTEKKTIADVKNEIGELTVFESDLRKAYLGMQLIAGKSTFSFADNEPVIIARETSGTPTKVRNYAHGAEMRVGGIVRVIRNTAGQQEFSAKNPAESFVYSNSDVLQRLVDDAVARGADNDIVSTLRTVLQKEKGLDVVIQTDKSTQAKIYGKASRNADETNAAISDVSIIFAPSGKIEYDHVNVMKTDKRLKEVKERLDEIKNEKEAADKTGRTLDESLVIERETLVDERKELYKEMEGKYPVGETSADRMKGDGWLGGKLSTQARNTVEWHVKNKKDNYFIVTEQTKPEDLLNWLEEKQAKRINITGNNQPVEMPGTITPATQKKLWKETDELVDTFLPDIVTYQKNLPRPRREPTKTVLDDDFAAQLNEYRGLISKVKTQITAKQKKVDQSETRSLAFMDKLRTAEPLTDSEKKLKKKYIESLPKDESEFAEKISKQLDVDPGTGTVNSMLDQMDVKLEMDDVMTLTYDEMSKAHETQAELLKITHDLNKVKKKIKDSKKIERSKVFAKQDEVHKNTSLYNAVLNASVKAPEDVFKYIEFSTDKDSSFQKYLDKAVGEAAKSQNLTREDYLNTSGKWINDLMGSDLFKLQARKGALEREIDLYKSKININKERDNIENLISQENKYNSVAVGVGSPVNFTEKEVKGLYDKITSTSDPINVDEFIQGTRNPDGTYQEYDTLKYLERDSDMHREVATGKASDAVTEEWIESFDKLGLNSIERAAAAEILYQDAQKQIRQIRKERNMLDSLGWAKSETDASTGVTKYNVNHGEVEQFKNYLDASKIFDTKYGAGKDKQVILDGVTKADEVTLKDRQNSLDAVLYKIDLENEKMHGSKYVEKMTEQRSKEQTAARHLEDLETKLNTRGLGAPDPKISMRDFITKMENVYPATSLGDWQTTQMKGTVKAVLSTDYLLTVVKPKIQRLQRWKTTKDDSVLDFNQDIKKFIDGGGQWDITTVGGKNYAGLEDHIDNELVRLTRLDESHEKYADTPESFTLPSETEGFVESTLAPTTVKNTRLRDKQTIRNELKDVQEEIQNKRDEMNTDAGVENSSRWQEELEELQKQERKLTSDSEGVKEWDRITNNMYSNYRATRQTSSEFDEIFEMSDPITDADINTKILPDRGITLAPTVAIDMDDARAFVNYASNRNRANVMQSEFANKNAIDISKEILGYHADDLKKGLDKSNEELNMMYLITTKGRLGTDLDKKSDLISQQRDAFNAHKKVLGGTKQSLGSVDQLGQIKNVLFHFDGKENAGTIAYKKIVGMESERIGKQIQSEGFKDLDEDYYLSGSKINVKYITGSDVGREQLKDLHDGRAQFILDAWVDEKKATNVSIDIANPTAGQRIMKLVEEASKINRQSKSVAFAKKLKTKTEEGKALINMEKMKEPLRKVAIIHFTDKDGVDQLYTNAGRKIVKGQQDTKKGRQTVYNPELDSNDRLLRTYSRHEKVRKGKETDYLLNPNAFTDESGEIAVKSPMLKQFVKDKDGNVMLAYNEDSDILVYPINPTDLKGLTKIKQKLHEQGVETIVFDGMPLRDWQKRGGTAVSRVTGEIDPGFGGAKTIVKEPKKSIEDAVEYLLKPDAVSPDKVVERRAYESLKTIKETTDSIDPIESQVKIYDQAIEVKQRDYDKLREKTVSIPAALRFSDSPDSIANKNRIIDNVAYAKQQKTFLAGQKAQKKRKLDKLQKEKTSTDVELGIMEENAAAGKVGNVGWMQPMDSVVTISGTDARTVQRDLWLGNDVSENDMNRLITGEIKTVPDNVLSQDVYYAAVSQTLDVPEPKLNLYQRFQARLFGEEVRRQPRNQYLQPEFYKDIENLTAKDEGGLNTLRKYGILNWDRTDSGMGRESGFREAIAKQYLVAIYNQRRGKGEAVARNFLDIASKPLDTKKPNADKYGTVLSWLNEGNAKQVDETWENFVRGKEIGPRKVSDPSDKQLQSFRIFKEEPTVEEWWKQPSKKEKFVMNLIGKKLDPKSPIVRKSGTHADRTALPGYADLMKKPRIMKTKEAKKVNLLRTILGKVAVKEEETPSKDPMRVVELAITRGQTSEYQRTIFGEQLRKAEEVTKANKILGEGAPPLELQQKISNVAVELDVNRVLKDRAVGKPLDIVIKGENDVKLWVEERDTLKAKFDTNKERIKDLGEREREIFEDNGDLPYKGVTELDKKKDAWTNLSKDDKEKSTALYQELKNIEDEQRKLRKDNFDLLDKIDPLAKKIQVSGAWVDEAQGIVVPRSTLDKVFRRIRTPRPQKDPQWIEDLKTTPFKIEINYPIDVVGKKKQMTTVTRSYEGIGSDAKVKVSGVKMEQTRDPVTGRIIETRPQYRGQSGQDVSVEVGNFSYRMEKEKNIVEKIDDVLGDMKKDSDKRGISSKPSDDDASAGKQALQTMEKQKEQVKEAVKQMRSGAIGDVPQQQLDTFRMGQRIMGTQAYAFETAQNLRQPYELPEGQQPFVLPLAEAQEQKQERPITDTIQPFDVTKGIMKDLPKIQPNLRFSESVGSVLGVGDILSEKVKDARQQITTPLIDQTSEFKEGWTQTEVANIKYTDKLQKAIGKLKAKPSLMVAPALTTPLPQTTKVNPPLIRQRPIIPATAALIPQMPFPDRRRPKQEKPKKGKKKKIGWQVPDVWFGYYSPQEYITFGTVGQKSKEPKKLRKQNKKLD